VKGSCWSVVAAVLFAGVSAGCDQSDVQEAGSTATVSEERAERARARAAEQAQGASESGPVRRPGSVVLEEEYNLEDLRIPLDEIHTLLPRDAIPSLTDPKLEAVADGQWLEPSDRVIAVVVGGEAIAAPLKILNFHEVANMTVGGEPVAATYCPLCDSATLVSREIETTGEDAGEDGEPVTEVLEFGVSGALYNSNVLMYDRTNMGLWSQLGMRCVSGPMAGAYLRHLPVRVVEWREFVEAHPKGKVLSRDTGHTRAYGNSPYASYFQNPDRLLVPVQGMGDALPRKTLGVGILAGDAAWFVAAEAIGEDGLTLETSAGDVELRATEAGVEVVSAPEGVWTAQTFYYSWSAFHPETEVVAE